MTLIKSTGKIRFTEMVVYEMTGENPFLPLCKRGFFPSMNKPQHCDKPFLRYDQMIDLMRSRNIEIKNEAFAKKVLSNMSYYTIINGYKDSSLSIPGSDLFLPGTRFEELYTLHTIDVAISTIVLKNILYIEKALKSKVAYLVSRNYGVFTDYTDPTNNNPDDYLFLHNYSSSNGARNNTLRSIKSTMDLTNQYEYHSPGLCYYLQKHNHIPPWILTTSISFGKITQWYRILKAADKKSICDSFIHDPTMSDMDKKEFIYKSFALLRDFRNMIAHNGQTFKATGKASIPKKQIVKLSSGIITDQDYNSNNYAQNGLYAVIATVMVLLNDEYLSNGFIFDFNHILKPYIQGGVKIHGKTIPNLFNIPDDIVTRMVSSLL